MMIIGKKDFFSYKYERYGFAGLGCTDSSGAPKSFKSLSDSPTNCTLAFDSNTVGQFNTHLEDYGGCAHGYVYFKPWYFDWYSLRLKDHPLKTTTHPQYGFKDVPVQDRAEACRMDAEEKDECAGANYYTLRTTGHSVKCQCGVGVQAQPLDAPHTMTCLLKSKPVADITAPGALKKAVPHVPGYNGDITMKKPGIKSTFKMSTNFTGCSKGWWHITGDQGWSRRLYSPDGSKGLLLNTGSYVPTYKKKGGWSVLPSECAKYAKALKDFPRDARWPNPKGCKGALGVMMNGVGTLHSGQPQDRCKCFWPEDWNKLDMAEVSTYAYPNYGETLHDNGNRDMWVCALDDDDPTGGDDVYPIPDSSGVVSPDGPKPKPTCTPIPALTLASASSSNLGGQGPDLDSAEGIRFSKVGKVKDVDIDLKLTSAGPYTPFKAGVNGLTGSLGTVNVQAGTKVDVGFSLVESGTDTPVAVDGLSLMFLDVDEGKRGRQRSTVTACDAVVELDDSTELTTSQSGSCTSVSSSKKGSSKDNPTSPENLTNVQKAKVVTFKYGTGAQFQAALSVAESPKSPTGRNFMFSVGILCDE